MSDVNNAIVIADLWWV